VLGGAMGAYDDAAAPWLPQTRDLLASAVADGVPTLGVCLGAQLLAVACGGTVARGAAGPELGPTPLRLTPAAADDPLFAGLPATVEAVQWHWDAVTEPPAGAVVLVEGATYPVQAFRLGRCAWGVQFHPEATVPGVAHWAQTGAARVRAAGLDPLALVAAASEREPVYAATWRTVAHRFAAVVSARASAGATR
jgi:GMP synthase-like glutamine amidotransferase